MNLLHLISKTVKINIFKQKILSTLYLKVESLLLPWKNITMPDYNFLDSLVSQVRRDILRMVHKVNSGHPGGSLGCAEFLVVLYSVIMNRTEGFNMDGVRRGAVFI